MPPFLHPAALWALATLALPLAIHLWRPPPRTVRLGSLRFLDRTARRPLRHLRWRELALLAARLALLVALVLLLAGPTRKFALSGHAQHWVLLDPIAKLTGNALAKWKQVSTSGNEIRLLALGFPQISSPPGASDASAPDVWSLLREADAQLPAGSSLTVFSSDRVASLRGVRPTMEHCQVEWIAADDIAGAATHDWVVSQYSTRVVEAHSNAQATTYAVKTVTGTATPLSVLILHDADHPDESAALEAAIHTAGVSVGQPVNILNRDITPDADNAAATDWLFWLSQKEPPASLVHRETRVFRYATGEAVAEQGHIMAPDEGAGDGIAIWRRLSAVAPSGAVVLWSDGMGDPMLTHSEAPAGHQTWILHTRLDPAWTDLPRTTALPAWMRSLLFGDMMRLASADPVHDLRRADPTQGNPQRAEGSLTTQHALAPVDTAEEPFHWPLCALVALLFSIERVLAFRRSNSALGASALVPAPLFSR